NVDGSVWVIFKGEIFNYVELRCELEAQGYRFKTSSDTETIVHAYEEYGISFAHKLNGMFAIAIWDTRKEMLFLYRDRFGVKPLFYATLPKDLVFGSEIKTVLDHPAVGRDLDYEALSHYLSLRNVPAPYTLYQDIRARLGGRARAQTGCILRATDRREVCDRAPRVRNELARLAVRASRRRSPSRSAVRRGDLFVLAFAFHEAVCNGGALRRRSGR